MSRILLGFPVSADSPPLAQCPCEELAWSWFESLLAVTNEGPCMKPGFLAALKSRQLACALLAQPTHPLAHSCHPSAPRAGLSRPRCLSCSRAQGEGKGSVCICAPIKCAKWEQNKTVAYPKMTRESLFVAKWETWSHVDWAAPPGCAGKSLPELPLMSQACHCVLGHWRSLPQI